MASPRRVATAAAIALAVIVASYAQATTFVVAQSGGDFTTVQAALDVAVAGDTVQVREKASPYLEKIVFPRSGNAGNGHITLEAFPGENPVLDGTGVSGADMVLLEDRSWIRLIGFEIRNNLNVNDGSGVRVLGAGSHIEIRDNRIHDIRGRHAMGITVYGTRATAISDLVIDGNEIYDCEPATSEALTLNGNVTDFEVTNNVVRDVNNIGIDFIGGETDIQPNPTLVARNGVCRGNRVERARSSYGGGFAGGIYVDGGRNIVIANNVVTESDLGIEIGAENGGTVTRDIVVRGNVLYRNDKAGLVFGGYASSAGRVEDCEFRNNTLYQNDTLGEGFGELWLQFASDNLVRNNVFVSTDEGLLLASYGGSSGNVLDHNLYFSSVGAVAVRFVLNGVAHTGFAAYRAATGLDASSLFGDPLLLAPEAADFYLRAGSPAIDAGDPATSVAPGEVDLDGAPRVSNARIDIGADEVTCGDGTPDPGEQCDDGDLIDGDGCDSNCTITGCGNAVVTAGEQCDPGVDQAADCCDVLCQLETAGASCDDDDACTRLDQCDGGGACVGAEQPEPVCRAAGRSQLRIRKGSGPVGDSVHWKWLRGDATEFGALGDPLNGTDYTVCLYDFVAATPQVRMRALVPGSATCSKAQCWRSTSRGYRLRGSGTSSQGIDSVVLQAGDAGRAKVILKGNGALLGAPTLPLAQSSAVQLQVRSSEGECWGATYAAPAQRNDLGQFQDKAP